MANQDVIAILRVLVEERGLKEVTQGLKSLNKETKTSAKQQNIQKRNMEGVHKEALGGAKAFARQAQGLGGLVRVYATVAANVFALSSSFLALKEAADYKIIIESTNELAVQTGRNLTGLARQIKDLTGGAISLKQAIASANLGTNAGLSGSQLENITQLATKAAQALGRSVPEAVTRLTQAIVKGEPELADEFGIILRLEKATDKYAKTIGKTKEELTSYERIQAVYNQFNEQATKNTAGLTDKVNIFDKTLATFTDTFKELGAVIVGPVEKALSVFADNSSAALGAILLFSTFLIKQAMPSLGKFGASIIAGQTAKIQASVDKTKAAVKELQRQRDLLDIKKSANRSVSIDSRAAIKDPLATVKTPYIKQLVKEMDTGKIKAEDFNKKMARTFGNLSTKTGVAFADIKAQMQAARKEFGKPLPLDRTFTSANGTLTLTVEGIRSLRRQMVLARRGTEELGTGVQNLKLKYNALSIAVVEASGGMKLGFNVALQSGLALGTTYTAFLTNLRKKFLEVGIASGSASAKIATVTGTLTFFATRSVSLLTSVGFKLLSFAALFGIVGSAVDAFGKYLGLSSKALAKAKADADGLSDSMVNLQTSINLEISQLGSVTTGFSEFVSKLKLSANISSQIADNFEKLESIIVGVTDQKPWDTFVFTLKKGIQDVINLLIRGVNLILTEGSQLAELDVVQSAAQQTAELFSNNLRLAFDRNKDLALPITGSLESINRAQETITKQIQAELQLAKQARDEEKARLERARNKNQATKRFNEAQLNVEQLQAKLDGLQPFKDKKITKDNVNQFIASVKSALDIAESGAGFGEGFIDQAEVQNVLKLLGDVNSTAKNAARATANDLQNQVAAGEQYLTVVEEFTSKMNDLTISTSSSNKYISDQATQFNKLALAFKGLNTQFKDKKDRENLFNQLQKGGKLQGTFGQTVNLSGVKNLEDLESKLVEKRKFLVNLAKQEKSIRATTAEAELKAADLLKRAKETTGDDAADLILEAEKLRTDKIKENIEYNRTLAGIMYQTLSITEDQEKQESTRAEIAKLLNIIKAEEARITKINNETSKAVLQNEIKTLDVKQKIADTESKALDTLLKADDFASRQERYITFERKSALEIKSIQIDIAKLVKKKTDNALKGLELALAEQEIEAKKTELYAKQLEILREQVDERLKITDDIFSEKGMKAIGDKFAMIAYDFAKKIKSSGELFVDVVSTGMNSAADAFGAALKNDFEGGLGEALKNIGRAALDGMKDVFIEQAVTGIKALGNQIFANMFSGSFSPADTELSVLQEIRDILAGKTSQSAFTQLDKDGILSKGNCKCTDAVEDFFGYTPESMREGAEDITDTLHEAKFSFKNVFTGMIDIFKNGAVGVANGLNALISSLTSQSGGGGIGSIFGSLIGPIFNGIVGGMFGSFATVGSGIAAQTGFTGGAAGVISGDEFARFAKGGIMSSMGEVALKRYATGGIANSPQMALYGEGSMPEAYVPLPDGRSIPVTMDGGGTTNNVTVIVNYDGGSGGETRQQNSSVASEQGVREFSQMISNKVKEELLNQTRPGGMLSR